VGRESNDLLFIIISIIIIIIIIIITTIPFPHSTAVQPAHQQYGLTDQHFLFAVLPETL
jgi:flagellar basal body-associated protein FliL